MRFNRGTLARRVVQAASAFKNANKSDLQYDFKKKFTVVPPSYDSGTLDCLLFILLLIRAWTF
jgi:hypothetical protein